MRYYSICLLGLSVTAFFFHPNSVRAQAAGNSGVSVVDAVKAAKQNFTALTDADVSTARTNLQTAATKLDQYLGKGANGQAWRAFLKLNELQAQLKPDAKPDLETLQAVQAQFATDHSGLEMPVFSNVNAALKNYLQSAAAVANAEGKTQYEALVDILVKALEQYAQKPSESDARTINDALAQLQATHQAPAVIKAIREQYGRPNLWVQVSDEIAGAGINKTLDETGPLNDNILGASVQGTAHTTGEITTKLFPSEKTGIMDTFLYGKAESSTTAFKGPASVRTRGVTNFTGRKRMIIDADGIKAFPARADAVTRSTILGVGVSGMFGQRIASNKAYESQEEAQEIAAEHAKSRVIRRIDEEATPSLAKANQSYKEKFRDPLTRAGAFPEMLLFSSTDSNLYVTALGATGVQIGAPTAPPSLDSSAGLSVRLHESLANNMGEAILAGKTITDESVQADAKRILGKVPEELQLEPDAEPWSMTFAAQHPVTVTITNGGFKVTVCGQRYTSGDRKLPAMNVSATYKVEKAGKGSKAVRQGDLEILPPGYTAGQRLSNQQIALRALLQKRFGKLLKPEMVSEGLKLPGKWEKAGVLVLKDLDASDSGWLSLGWQQDSSPPAPPVASQHDDVKVAGLRE